MCRRVSKGTKEAETIREFISLDDRIKVIKQYVYPEYCEQLKAPSTVFINDFDLDQCLCQIDVDESLKANGILFTGDEFGYGYEITDNQQPATKPEGGE